MNQTKQSDTDFEFTEKQRRPALNKMKIRWIYDETPILKIRSEVGYLNINKL